MRPFLSAALLLAASLARCPSEDRPDPRPLPAGQGGAPSAGGGGDAGRPSAGAGGAPGGFGGAPAPAGAGGAPGGDTPLCTLPPAPGPDRALDDVRARHAAALAALGFGAQAAWLLYRETFGSKTTLVAVPPVGSAWTRARLEQVRTKMGTGFVSAPGDGVGNGFKNPCAPAPPRVAGLGQDAPALP
ncbi:MAG TPA: hypothetical protein VFS00_03465 [Polyangiaceae bacterium]|nr:hypothetical protein [Polyangiaceae bacterium]